MSGQHVSASPDCVCGECYPRRRRRLDADDFAVLVIACAVMLGSCHGARASEPLHAFAPPTQATWDVTLGRGGLGIVLTPDTWETALESVELLDAVTEERDRLRDALDAERKVSASLRAEIDAAHAEIASLRLSLESSRATVFRLESKRPRRALGIGLSLFAGALAGAAVSR